jgi:hypothetical protein
MEAKTMTSSSARVAWRGHLADETDEDLLCTSTTMGDKDLMYIDTLSREEVPSTKHDFRDTFIAYNSWMRHQEHFWTTRLRHRQLFYVAEVSGRISIVAPTEEEGQVPDALTSLSPWPTLFPHAEPELGEVEEGGVYSPPHKREVIFSLTMEFQTADLPRLKPSMFIDPLMLPEDDDA